MTEENLEMKIKTLPKIPVLGERIFYGWVIVAVGMVGQFLQGIAFQGFTTYLGPLHNGFGWNRELTFGVLWMLPFTGVSDARDDSRIGSQ